MTSSALSVKLKNKAMHNYEYLAYSSEVKGELEFPCFDKRI